MIERDIFGITNLIKEYLSEKCENCTLRWKNSASTSPDDYLEAKPTVYEYTYDGEEIPETPSVLIQTTRITLENIHYVIYISVVHSAVQECEKADLVEGAENEYTYRTETVVEDGQDVEIPATGYTSDNVRRELYRVTLMLGDYVFRMLMQMGNSKARISNLTLAPPSAFMQEFPYCSATIEMDVAYISKPTAVVNTELYDLL